MRKMLMTLVPLAALVAVPGFAAAQQGTVGGAAAGAAAGAVVGGPVGAVVGGAAGLIAGTALEAPPPEVRGYVVEQRLEPVVIEREIVVGEPLPAEIVLYPVEPEPRYYYAVVNSRHVVVDPETRVIVAVYD